MSRRLPPSQRPRVHPASSDNPYQPTTLSIPLPVPHTYSQQNTLPHTYSQQNTLPHTYSQQNTLPYTKDNAPNASGNSYQGGGLCNNVATFDTGVSDDTCSDSNTYYDYHYGYQYASKKEPRNTDCIYSDNSEATEFPYFEYNETSSKRFSRNNFPDNSYSKKAGSFNREAKFNASTHKDVRKVYPNHENAQRTLGDNVATQTNLPLRIALSRLSDRPQSSLSSGVTSAVVDGCGGHCQTFENVCYYFLQVVFTMGILIGTSLSIAGAVLRKSAARNLQVLVYIGALLCMVSALLLAIQCSARYSARKRKKALRSAKRAPIPLETLHSRPTVLQQHQPLMGEHSQRVLPTLHLQVPAPHMQPQRSALREHQGIPWWRRKDLN